MGWLFFIHYTDYNSPCISNRQYIICQCYMSFLGWISTLYPIWYFTLCPTFIWCTSDISFWYFCWDEPRSFKIFQHSAECLALCCHHAFTVSRQRHLMYLHIWRVLQYICHNITFYGGTWYLWIDIKLDHLSSTAMFTAWYYV